ncbi:hypothetical protein FM120_23090 [Sphingobacterium faecium PCAi_F2.5]|nr:hypothetical protein FM120_23090 [Sphingobacterium faecium PCAi_F2.5]
MKLNCFAYLFMFILLVTACSKSNDENIIPEEPQPKESIYLFLKEEIIDFKVYKGSVNGGIEVSKTEKPESFWNPYKLIDLKYDTLIVRNDSIFERPEKYEKNNFRFRVSNDTIYQWNRYAEFWALYGLKKDDIIEHYISFYSFQKATPPYLFAENGHNDGLVDSSRYFSNNEYVFKSPKNMLSVNDLATWYNTKHIFKKLTKDPK